MKLAYVLVAVLSISQLYNVMWSEKDTEGEEYLVNTKKFVPMSQYLIDRELNPKFYENLDAFNDLTEFTEQNACEGMIWKDPSKKQRVYFNDSSQRDNLEFYIKRALDRTYCHSNPELLIAAYELSNPNIIKKLKRLKETVKNITIKIVLEEDVLKKSNGKRALIKELKEIGINIKTDKNVRGNNLMHHKFMIINKTWLLTGSTNFSKRGMNVNANNLVEIFSEKLCKTYIQEFEKLWSKEFSRRKKNVGKLKTAEPDIRSIIGPSKNVNKSLFSLISSAQKSVDIAMFSLTSKPILKTLTVLKNANTRIRLKLDNLTLGSSIDIDGKKQRLESYLKKNKIPYLSDESNAMFHHKYIIIDGQTESSTVITGSMNMSDNGFYKNDENLLVLKNEKIVNKFIENFEYGYESNESHQKEVKDVKWPEFYRITKKKDKMIVSVLNVNDSLKVKVKDNNRWLKSHIDYGTRKEFFVNNSQRKHVLKLYSSNGIFFKQLELNTSNSVLKVPEKNCTYSYLKSNMWYDC